MELSCLCKRSTPLIRDPSIQLAELQYVSQSQYDPGLEPRGLKKGSDVYTRQLLVRRRTFSGSPRERELTSCTTLFLGVRCNETLFLGTRDIIFCKVPVSLHPSDV